MYYSDIIISETEAETLLELGHDFKEDLEEVVKLFSDTVNPRGSFRIYDSFELFENGFIIEGVKFNSGKKIAKALYGSERIAVILATAGNEVETIIKKYNEDYDFIKSYWCDKLSNMILDKLMLKLIEEIRISSLNDGMLITSNWGPGYCGWSIEEQFPLLSLSDAEELGITLSSSMLMNPVKSISGVIGIGKNVVFRKSGCGDCNLHKCAYRSLKW